MEMPVDVLNKRLGKIRDNGDIDFDNTMAAVDIDSELQEKFIFFPIEELEAVEIEDDRGRLNAGDGPEHCAAGPGENPNWLYNHAMNALALWWRLKQDQERLSKRPEPGVYQATTAATKFIVIVTEDRRVLVPVSIGVPDLTDYTAQWDSGTVQWPLQRIDTVTGVIANG